MRYPHLRIAALAWADCPVCQSFYRVALESHDASAASIETLPNGRTVIRIPPDAPRRSATILRNEVLHTQHMRASHGWYRPVPPFHDGRGG